MDWLDTLAGYANQGVEAYTKVKNAGVPKSTAPATGATITPNAWLVPALLGGGLLLVLVFVFAGRK